MATRVRANLSDRQISEDSEIRAALQREVIPVVKEIRRRFNELVDEFVDELAGIEASIDGLETDVSDLEALLTSELEGVIPLTSVRSEFSMMAWPGSTSSTFLPCHTTAGTGLDGLSCNFDPTVHPLTARGLTRKVYIEVTLEAQATGGSDREFRVFNVTDSEAVTGTLQAHNLTSQTTYTLGPLTVGSSAGDVKDSRKVYRVETRHISASAGLRVLGCAWVIKWE